MYLKKTIVLIYRDTHSTSSRSSWYNWRKTLVSCIMKEEVSVSVRFKSHRKSQRFERIVKKFISLKCVVHLCGAIGVAPIYQSAGLEFEYLRGFYFHEQYLSFKNCYFFTKKFLSLSSRTHAGNPYLYVI